MFIYYRVLVRKDIWEAKVKQFALEQQTPGSITPEDDFTTMTNDA